MVFSDKIVSTLNFVIWLRSTTLGLETRKNEVVFTTTEKTLGVNIDLKTKGECSMLKKTLISLLFVASSLNASFFYGSRLTKLQNYE